MSTTEAPALHTFYAAVPASVFTARLELADLAERAGASPEQIERVSLAASEAITNAVQHAYSEPGGDIEVFAGVTGSELFVFVADRGEGLREDQRSEGLGWGLALIRMSCDALTVADRSDGGVELRMRFAIGAVGAGGRWDQLRGSVPSASRPASPSFSTTT
jgi:anti-sigma regulatory factor (Ser/Thr protein kinase)